MLVLLKTAFYVAGWVMGVNGFGFLLFRRKVHSSLNFILSPLSEFRFRDRRRPRPPSLGIRRLFLSPRNSAFGKEKKNYAMKDEGCPGTERWDDFVPSKVVSLAWADQCAFQDKMLFKTKRYGT